MNRLSELISYESFGQLKFLKFFPKTESYYIDKVGMQSLIGPSTFEGYGPSAGFFSKPKLGGITCGLGLDFNQGIPEEDAHRLLDQIGLPVRKGMSAEQLRKLLGRSQELGVPERTGYNWFRWVIGTQWPYYVDCPCSKDTGLFGINVFRKDLVDKEENLRA
jgi:hypothetical protein